MSKSNGQAEINIEEQQKLNPEHELPPADASETLSEKPAEAGQPVNKPGAVASWDPARPHEGEGATARF